MSWQLPELLGRLEGISPKAHSLLADKGFRAARSGQGRAWGAAQRTLDGEDRSEKMR